MAFGSFCSSACRDGPSIKSSFSTGSILARSATSPGLASAGARRYPSSLRARAGCRWGSQGLNPSYGLHPTALLLSLPYDPAKISLARIEDAGRRRRLDEEPIAFDPIVTPLLGAVPVFIPGNVHGRDEVAAFDAIFSTVGQHRLVQCRPLGNPVSRLAAAGGGNRHCAAPRRQQQVTFRGRTERILYLVPHNHLPRNKLPVADQGIGIGCPGDAGDRNTGYQGHRADG